MILILGSLFLLWIWYQEPVRLLAWWNRQISTECDRTDAICLNGIPSYQNAWECSNSTAVKLHQLIHLNHDQILKEVLETMNHTVSIDWTTVQHSNEWIEDDHMWVKFMGEYAVSQLPTLTRIATLFPEVITLYISVFKPGTISIEHKGRTRMTQRYHYGLKVANNDVGFRIRGSQAKWIEKEGFLWDNTLPHSLWNHTTEPRITIVADIMREFSAPYAIGSRLLYSWLQRAEPVREIQKQLQAEEMMLM